jgi:hypothetical protein
MARVLAGRLPKPSESLTVGDDVAVIIKKKKHWTAPKYYLVGPSRKVISFMLSLREGEAA